MKIASERFRLKSVLVSAAAIVALATAVLFALREPAPDPKTIDNWILLLNGGDSDARRAALNALGKLGPRAVPLLLNRVRAIDPLPQRLYRALWTHFPVSIQGKVPKPKIWDYSTKYRVAAALSFLGPDSLPGLLRATNDRNREVRYVVVGNLGRFVETSDQAFDRVLNALRDPSAYVRIKGVMALGSTRRDMEKIVPKLIQALGDKDSGDRPGQIVFVRAAAARRLGELGPAASSAVPMLRTLMGQGSSTRSDAYTSIQAAVALWRIERKADDLIPFLAAHLRNPADTDGWPAILEAFAEMGPVAREAIPDIKGTLRAERDGRVRVHFPLEEVVTKALLRIESESNPRDKPK